MILFPLYEKHLRFKFKMGERATFSVGHRAVRQIGRDLNLSEEDTVLFWDNMRNGLLHKALPKDDDGFRYALHRGGKPVEKKNSVFWIDAFALRDHLLKEIEAHLDMWKQDDVILPTIFDPLEV